MALYINITKECEEDAKKYGKFKDLISFKEKVLAAQRICYFDNFPPPYLKKRFGNNHRMIACYHSYSFKNESHLIISFLRMYITSIPV